MLRTCCEETAALCADTSTVPCSVQARHIQALCPAIKHCALQWCHVATGAQACAAQTTASWPKLTPQAQPSTALLCSDLQHSQLSLHVLRATRLSVHTVLIEQRHLAVQLQQVQVQRVRNLHQPLELCAPAGVMVHVNHQAKHTHCTH